MIEISDADADARMEAVASIHRGVAHRNHIVKSMLYFGRDHSAQKKPLSLKEVITASRTHLREEIDHDPNHDRDSDRAPNSAVVEAIPRPARPRRRHPQDKAVLPCQWVSLVSPRSVQLSRHGTHAPPQKARAAHEHAECEIEMPKLGCERAQQ